MEGLKYRFILPVYWWSFFPGVRTTTVKYTLHGDNIAVSIYPQWTGDGRFVSCSGPYFDDAVESGNLAKDPSQIGGYTHAAVFYGRGQDGAVYVYTKNGLNFPPQIMNLDDLQKIPGYGTPRGLNNTSGYYTIKNH